MVFSRGAGVKVRQTPEKDRVIDACTGRLKVLRDICHMASTLAAGKLEQINVVEKHTADSGLQDAADAVEKGAFAGAVVAKNTSHSPSGNIQVDVFPELAFTVGKAQSANLQHV